MAEARDMTEETIFAAALEKPPAERAAFLTEACGGDQSLCRRLEKLLAANERAGDFMANPAVALAQPSGDTELLDRGAAPDPANTGAVPGRVAPRDDTDDDPNTLAFLAPTTRPDSLGRLGHYEMLQLLSKGGFGIVFRASDEMLQRVVAIKVLAPIMAATSPARKRFLREARSFAKVRHENVVQIYAVEEQPLPYLAMEFIPGETLQQRCDRVGPLEVPEVLRIGRQIAEGLAAAHATGLIHRDIKPSNILIENTPQEHIKITDFGLARAADDASITQSGYVAGTPMYMSPEQARGEPVDHRSDLFSLGSVLYTMTSGRPPFRAANTPAVLKRVTDDTPRPIKEIIPETPRWLCDFIAKLQAKDAADRFQTARDVVDRLAECERQWQPPTSKEIAEALAASDAKPAPRAPSLWRWAALAALIPIVGLLISEVAGLTDLFGRRPPAPVTRKDLGEQQLVAAAAPNAGDKALGGKQTDKGGKKLAKAPAGAKDDAIGPLPPMTEAEVMRIAALPAAQQVEEVRKELNRRNLAFDGTLTPLIQGDAVVELQLSTAGVTDISAVRALTHLQVLFAGAERGAGGSLVNLAPLSGMSLSTLYLHNNKITDLSPLVGLSLTSLDIGGNPVADLSPLKDLPLKNLSIGDTKVRDLTQVAQIKTLTQLACIAAPIADLTPLKGMNFTELTLHATPVADLAPLEGMPLRSLNIDRTRVSNLAPLKSMKSLEVLLARESLVTDLSPLKELPLQVISCNYDPARDGEILRSIKTLRVINEKPAAEFFK
jgi:hypothetical protein